MEDSRPVVYRSRTNMVIAVIVWLALAIGAVAVLVSIAGSGGIAWELIPLAFVAVLAYELFWQPSVTVDDEHVLLTDVFRTVEIPWSIVIAVDTKWALTITTPKRSYRSSAAPAPGYIARPRLGRDSTSSQVGRDGVVRKSDALGTDSGDAANIVRTRWTQLIENQSVPIGRADIDRATVHVHRLAVTAVLVLGAASVFALLQL